MSGRRFIPSGVPKGVHLGATVDRHGRWHDREGDIPVEDRHDCSTHLPEPQERIRRTTFGHRLAAWQAEAAEATGVGADVDFAAETSDYAELEADAEAAGMQVLG